MMILKKHAFVRPICMAFDYFKHIYVGADLKHPLPVRLVRINLLYKKVSYQNKQVKVYDWNDN